MSKRVKARRKKAAAAAALRCPRLKPLSFSLPCDATNIRGGDLLALVPDKDAARAVARELRSTFLITVVAVCLAQFVCVFGVGGAVQSLIPVSKPYGACGRSFLRSK